MTMKILVLNLGTTSFKFKLYDFASGEVPQASGQVERVGSGRSAWKLAYQAQVRTGKEYCANHEAAFHLCMDLLADEQIISSLSELDGVGFKAVHGGPLRGAQEVDEHVLSTMNEYAAFAPAHNPMYTGLMRKLRTSYPRLCQVACFETSFHAEIPLKRVVYGVPFDWVEKYGIRRYGFHGSSHNYIAVKMQEVAPEAQKIISLHLGGSSSLCAIVDGKSIAASMGATPQSGLFQNNRVGDFDSFCLPRLIEVYGDLDKVMEQLSTQSGFQGLSGVSNDLRDVIEKAEIGNEQAKLAIDAFIDNCIGYIGMYIAYMQGVDALVFTGGIGLNCTIIRERICEHFDYLRIKLDPEKNRGKISIPESSIEIWTLEANEELIVARQAREVLSALK